MKTLSDNHKIEFDSHKLKTKHISKMIKHFVYSIKTDMTFMVKLPYFLNWIIHSTKTKKIQMNTTNNTFKSSIWFKLQFPWSLKYSSREFFILSHLSTHIYVFKKSRTQFRILKIWGFESSYYRRIFSMKRRHCLAFPRMAICQFQDLNLTIICRTC